MSSGSRWRIIASTSSVWRHSVPIKLLLGCEWYLSTAYCIINKPWSNYYFVEDIRILFQVENNLYIDVISVNS